MAKIKVSVIVPVYNVEEYLPKCLDSLVNQTLQDIEILVINDGSPDNCQAIIDDYAARYPEKIRSYIKENGGLSEARNFGVAKATGEYIAFVDSDDYVDIDAYEHLYNKAAETDADVVNSPYTAVINRTVARKYYGDSMQYFGKSVSEAPCILRYANSIACNKIFRRTFWLSNNFMFPVGQWFEDSALIYRVLWYANKVECVNIPFYYYVKSREDSITNTIDTRVFDVIKSAESIVEFFGSLPQTPALTDEITYLCLRHTLARAFKFNMVKEKAFAKKFLDECYVFFDKYFPDWRKNSFVNPPAGSSFSDRCRGLILRHKWLAKTYYVNNTLQNIKKFLLFLKKGFSALLKKRFSPEKRAEIANQKKRDAIQKNGVPVMCLVQRLLSEIDVLSFADFGTMLGIVREGRLLAHDLDMDMGVIIKDDLDREKIRLHLEKFGFNLWRQYLFGENIVEESYRFCGIKVDLNYYKITETESKTWLFYREPGVEYEDNKRNIVEMIYSPIKEFRTASIQGEDVLIPANAEQLLEEKYGPTWRTPDKGWIYWLSPAATKIPDIGYYIDYRYFRTTEVNEEWFAKAKAKELSEIRKYQLKQIEVLKEVSDICKKYNIKFCLSNNTLRYAKQYGKMASWETNVYIAMTKENYDKFLAVAPNVLQEGVVLQHRKTVKKYWSPNMAVRSIKDKDIFKDVSGTLLDRNCPGVEILPLYRVSENVSKTGILNILFALLAYKSGRRKVRSLKGRLVRIISCATPYFLLHKCIDSICADSKDSDAKYLMNAISSCDSSKSANDKEYFDNLESIEFEGIEMPIPSCSDKILKKRYGFFYDKPVSWSKRFIPGFVYNSKN